MAYTMDLLTFEYSCLNLKRKARGGARRVTEEMADDQFFKNICISKNALLEAEHCALSMNLLLTCYSHQLTHAILRQRSDSHPTHIDSHFN